MDSRKSLSQHLPPRRTERTKLEVVCDSGCSSLLSHVGGTIVSLSLQSGSTALSILEHPLTQKEMLENVHYAGVKLIPFPGRITNATYTFQGKTYHLHVNAKDNFAIHGFVSGKPFRTIRERTSGGSTSTVLSYIHKGGIKGYPFRFSVQLKYVLQKGSFSCTTTIRNIDSRPLPIGDGWHPYFRTIGPIKDLLLSLPSHSVVEVTLSKVPTGAIRRRITGRTAIPLNRKHLDSVFDFGPKRQRLTTKLIDRKLGVEIQLWQESGEGKYRYLILYRPPSGSSIAIEPWTCAPDAFNNGMGLIILKPGKSFRASYGVILKRIQEKG